MSITVETRQAPINIEVGHKLPDSPSRQKLQRMIARACDEISSALGVDRQRAHFVDALNTRIPKELDGVDIIEEGNRNDVNNTCIHFTFGEILQEEWARPNTRIEDSFRRDPLGFLKEKGYTQIDKPVPGCVVAYADSSQWAFETGEIQLSHYGIVDDYVRVISKIATGPVINHPLEVVPMDYGDTAFYFIKESE